MDVGALVAIVAGIVLLAGGAEGLVRGSSALASAAGISHLVIGLTVVAFGSSSSELSISIGSLVRDESDIAVGNIIGTNIFNVLVVIGLSAVITPLAVSAHIVRLETPLLTLTTVALLLIVRDGTLSQIEGAWLITAGLAYTIWVVWESRANRDERDEGAAGSKPQVSGGMVLKNLVFVAVGLALLIVGSNWFVDGAVELAQSLGVSELVIGLTVVGAGTSMPEAVTSVIAALQGKRDIAVGNIIGSNLVNVLAILGITGVIAGGGIEVADAVVRFDLPVLIAVSLACLPIFVSGCAISRWEGLLFVGLYVAYATYLLLDASGHDAVEPYSRVMVLFVLPLVLTTLVVIGLRAWSHRNETVAARRQRDGVPP